MSTSDVFQVNPDIKLQQLQVSPVLWDVYLYFSL